MVYSLSGHRRLLFPQAHYKNVFFRELLVFLFLLRRFSGSSEMEESEISLEQIEESRRRLSQRPFIRVVCNEQVGHLYMNLFHCPGGHVPCIEYCGHMVSPEAFCASANNETDPNDWKDSIRIGRRNLRWLMRHSILDFHDHKQSCTNLCLSHKEIVT